LGVFDLKIFWKFLLNFGLESKVSILVNPNFARFWFRPGEELSFGFSGFGVLSLYSLLKLDSENCFEQRYVERKLPEEGSSFWVSQGLSIKHFIILKILK